MRSLTAALALLILAGCSSGPSSAAPKTAAPAVRTPTPTPTESASIVGSWHVVVTTTQAYGDLDNKVGETYTRDWTLTMECPAPSCVAQLQTVTGTGPATLNWSFDSGVYHSQLSTNLACTNAQGGVLAVAGDYRLVITAAAMEAGVFRGNAFAASFVEDFNPDAAAVAHGCRHSHIEQKLAGTRTA